MDENEKVPVQEPSTAEEILAKKKEAFEKDPSRFVGMAELLIAAKPEPGGISYLFQSDAPIALLKQIAFDIWKQVSDEIDKKRFKAQQDKMNNNRIIKPGGPLKNQQGIFGRNKR